MAMCKKCGDVFSSAEMIDGLCKNCQPPEIRKINEEKQAKSEEYKKNKDTILKSIIITSETSLENIEERITFASAECVYGLNLIKDLFAGVRDIVGGRIKSIEEPLSNAKEIIIEKLKEQAYFAGGNAVIGVRIEHTYNNTGGANILSVIGTGTIVKIKDF